MPVGALTYGVEPAVAALRRELDGRAVVWHGIRGEDGEALLQLPELAASYSITAPLRSGRIPAESNVAFEDLAGVRPDLDRPDLDRDLDFGPAADEFRRRLLRDLSRRCVVVTYRPSTLVTGLAFSMAGTMTLAGPYRDRQAAFEHKPWVERSLGACGVRCLGWTYVADGHRSRIGRMLERGPLVLRVSTASGGVGIVPVFCQEDVERHWPEQPEAFVAVAPFLDPAIPVNFSGCVFQDGSARMHPPSVQLIGVESCTHRPFGYCGNDFGAVATLGDDMLADLDDLGLKVAAWLHDQGYRGAFGVDALVHEEHVLFTEVNPRFQGSSALSAEIAARLDVPDLFLDHLAAMLGLPPSVPPVSLTEWAHRQPSVSRVVTHNTSTERVARDHDRPLPPRTSDYEIAQLARKVAVEPGGAVFSVMLPRTVTRRGFEIDERCESALRAVRAAFCGVASRREGVAS